MTSIPQIFNHKLIALRQQRAARTFTQHDFLHQHAAEILAERLSDIRKPLSQLVTIGTVLPPLQQAIAATHPNAHHTALPAETLYRDTLPLIPNGYDAILCAMGLQWVNDLPGILLQMHHALTPDGVLIAVFPGGDSLVELRHALQAAELELTGGIAPRISPMVNVRDAGSLLQRAGFNLPMADSERLSASYSGIMPLLHELRGMGLTNMLHQQPMGCAPRLLFPFAETHYRAAMGCEERLPATFELLVLTGWKPHASQPTPAKRGSGTMHLGDALK